MPEIADFVVEISNPADAGFSVSKSKMLRFTLTWALDHPQHGKLGDSADGCLAYYTVGGKLKWAPHKVRTGPRTTKQLHWITPAYYNLVLKMLEDSGYAEYLKTPAFEFARRVETLPPELPRIIRLKEKDEAEDVQRDDGLDSNV
jgi:hypothetical protein